MIFRILAKNVANITKAAFYLYRLTFCQKKVMEKKNSTLADFQGKNFRFSAEKCLEEFSEGQILQKNVIRIIYWLWERKFQTFPQKIPAKLSERRSMYPEDEFQEINCFWKYRILQFPPTSRRTIRTVSDKFLAGFSFMHFAYPKGGFGRDSCLESGLHNHGL